MLSGWIFHNQPQKLITFVPDAKSAYVDVDWQQLAEDERLELFVGTFNCQKAIECPLSSYRIEADHQAVTRWFAQHRTRRKEHHA